MEKFPSIANPKTEISEVEKPNKNETENNLVIENLRKMENFFSCIIDKLAQGEYIDDFKTENAYLQKQSASDFYYIRKKAESYLEIIDSAIYSVEEEAILSVTENNQDGKNYLRYDFIDKEGNSANSEIHKALMNWNELSDKDKQKHYESIVRYSPQLTAQELIQTSYSRGEENFEELYIDVPLYNNYIGRYSWQGKLEFAYPFSKNNSKALSKEDIIQKFFEREKELKKETNSKTADENYLFFSFSDLNIREYLEKDFGIKMEELSLYEQKQFLYLIKDLKVADFKEFSEFLGKDSDEEERLNKIKSFLVLELDSGLGEKIIKMGNNLNPEVANNIFKKIAELSDFASKETEDLKKIFYTDKQGLGISGSRTEMLKKAQKIIIEFSNALENKTNQQESIEKLLADLDKTKIEIELLHSVLKSAKENNENILFEMIKDLGIETKEIGEDLSEEEKDEIFKISNQNYFKIVFPNEPEKAKIIVGGLEKELFPERFPNEKIDSVKNQRTYTLKYKGNIIAFYKLKLIEGKPDELEFTSVNVSPELHGLNIGEYFISKVLETESKNHIINGESFAKNTVANSLYKKQGFVMVDDYSEKYGEPMFKMRMDKRESSQ